MARKQNRLLASRTPRWQIVAAFAAILTLYGAMRLPGIGVPLDRDEGAFGYIGQMIREGKLPYRDCLDHKPPIAFYINALALQFVHPTERGIHIFLLLYNLLTLVCVFYLGKTYFRSLSAGLWSAFAYAVFSASPAIQGFTASTEMWMLLPISLCLYLAVLGHRRHNDVLLLLSGIAGAVAFWTKQTALTSILFVFLFLVLRFLRPDHDSENRARTIRNLACWFLGAASFSTLLMSYFYARGIFREFVYWSFVHNLVYMSQPSIARTLDLIQPRLLEIFEGDFVVLVVAGIAAIWCSVKKRSEGYFISGFLLLSFLGTVPGFAFRHYFAQLTPAVAIAAGYGFSVFFERIRTANARFAAVVLCGLLILTVPIAVNRQYFLERNPNAISRYYFELNPFPESKPLAAFLAEASTPEDPILVVGSEPQILLYSGRRSPSAFAMIYPLMSSYPRYKEFQERMWAEIERTPPKFILTLVNLPGSFLWDKVADLEIMRNLDNLLKLDYTVDRAMLVGGLQGEWVNADDTRLADRDATFVYVFRRK